MSRVGDELRQLASIIDSGVIRPVVDQVFPSNRPKQQSITSSRDVQRARSSSRSDDDVRKVSERPACGAHRFDLRR
ncbi:hypothetical protein ACVH9Z_21445 [Rhodococcus opacus]|uniref:hypothetical protein n=1 Tax=Rhodococcus opacus TaxID=37919 RepID=UPI003D135CA3